MATAKIVICPRCRQKFDRNKEPYVKPSSTRYGHVSCYPELVEIQNLKGYDADAAEELAEGTPIPVKHQDESEKDQGSNKEEAPAAASDMELLKDYIHKLLGDKARWSVITRQIDTFQKQNMTLTGMMKALNYFYEIKHNPIDKANGTIGIIPYCYADAYKYYYAIYLAQKKNEEVQISSDIKVIKIKLPTQKGTLYKLFDIE